MVKKRILVIADDKSVFRSIRECMENDSTDVCCASSPAEALDNFMKQEYCLVIMDVPLANTDCLDILRIMRETKHTPILVIAPSMQSEAKVALFRAGANACIEKPMDITVCAAQSATLIQLYLDSSNVSEKHYPLTFGTELIISPLYRQVMIDGIQIELTRTEFDLLFCLAQHCGQVWSRSQLYHYVWSDPLGLDGENTVRTHIGNLRKKLADAGKDYVQTTRGIGYKFVPPNPK